MKFKIAILICWYGEWPWYFNFFLHSVRFNPTVDFLIVTDTKVVDLLPDNVQIVHKTLNELKALAKEKLELNVVIETPYKLCDFKPAYGLIFEDYLKDYEFWGHGDIDLIFGNIRKFITDDLLYNYDFINVRHDFITGFFALFRNNKIMNTLFMTSKDYRKVYSTERHYCFDECNFLQPYLKKNIPLEQLPSEIESMEHIVRKSVKSGLIKAHYDFLIVESNPGKLRWQNGELFYKEKFESLFFHLIRFKKLPYLMKPYWNEIPNTFYIHSFYFSKYKPKSLFGTIEKSFISFNAISYKTKTWLKWHFYNIVGTFAKNKNIQSQHHYLGTYKSNNSIIAVGIGNKLNNLFLLEGLQVTPLKQIKENEFMAKKNGYKIKFNFNNKANFSMEDVFNCGFDKNIFYKL